MRKGSPLSSTSFCRNTSKKLKILRSLGHQYRRIFLLLDFQTPVVDTCEILRLNRSPCLTRSSFNLFYPVLFLSKKFLCLFGTIYSKRISSTHRNKFGYSTKQLKNIVWAFLCRTTGFTQTRLHNRNMKVHCMTQSEFCQRI